MKEENPESEASPYIRGTNLEAHVIADMLRIESITTELREFKEESRKRFDKLENWIIAIIGVTTTTLISIIVAIMLKSI